MKLTRLDFMNRVVKVCTSSTMLALTSTRMLVIWPFVRIGSKDADVHMTDSPRTALASDNGSPKADQSDSVTPNVRSRSALVATATIMGSSTYVLIRAVAVPITDCVILVRNAATRPHVSGAPLEPCVVLRKT